MKLRILLIDDAAFIRDLIKRTLRKFLPNSEVMEAQDGKRAQSILNKHPVDLILSDWEMPGMSGEELLIWVRSQEKIAATPFIMISSLGEKAHIMRAVESGVSDYLGKPFSSEELMQKVQKALLKSGKLKPVVAAPLHGGGAFSSLEIFRSRGEPSVSGSADALTGAYQPEQKPPKETSRMKGTGVVRFSDHQLKCMIKTVNGEEMSIIARRSATNPGVLDPVQLDISPNNEAGTILAGLSGYIHSLAAVEKKYDAEFLSIVIRFNTSDAKTKDLLSQFLMLVDQGN